MKKASKKSSKVKVRRQAARSGAAAARSVTDSAHEAMKPKGTAKKIVLNVSPEVRDSVAQIKAKLEADHPNMKATADTVVRAAVTHYMEKLGLSSASA